MAYAQSHTVHRTQEYNQENLGPYSKINCLPCYVEFYKIATKMNSNIFTEFDMKK